MKWGAIVSEGFWVSNGVCQGIILSPKLFAVYVDNLSKSLKENKIGFMIDEVCFKHLFYADDLCLLAPCAIASQQLPDRCYEYDIKHDIIMNALW